VALRRDNRSRGYGFVTFENETDMQAAQKAVDKKTVQDREISVRVVLGDERKPPVRDTRGAPSGGIVGGPRAPRIPRAPRPAGEPSPTLTFFGNLPYTVDDAKLNGLLAGYKVATPAKVSLRHDGRSLGFALVNFESAAEQQKAIAALNNTQFEGRQIKVEQSSGHRTPRAPRVPHPPRTPLAGGEASKTTLFVANLPYIVDDAGLLQIFEGFQVKEAHVPRRRNGMSTGYGFVTLATEVESQRALKEVDKSLVEKREISVRPAFNRPAAAAGAAPAAAPAPATAQ
jgi:RNA recognition motif-containing protein